MIDWAIIWYDMLSIFLKPIRIADLISFMFATVDR